MYKGKIRAPRRVGVRSAGADDFEENWALIRDALDDIHNQNAGKLSFEQLYRASYKIVLKKRGEDLYARVVEFEQRFFAESVIPRIWQLVPRGLVAATVQQQQQQQQQNGTAASSSLTNGNADAAGPHARREMGERLLRGIKDAWERHNMSMNMVADVLMYLDRGYAQDAGRPFIYSTTIGLFRDHILHAPLRSADGLVEAGVGAGAGTGAGAGAGAGVGAVSLFSVLAGVLLDQINMDRDGEIVDRPLLRSCVAMLEALYETDDEREDEKLYRTLFEPAYLEAAHAYYRAECQRLLRDGDARAWLRQTRRRLRDEQDRCGHTVSQETRSRAARVVEEELIAAHLEAFLAMDGGGLKAMVDNNRVDDLAILYELVSRVEAKKPVFRQTLHARILDLGLEIEKTLRETDFSAVSAAAAAEEDEAAATAAGKGPPAERQPAENKPPSSAAAQQTAAAIKWVNDILELKDKFDRLWRECFQCDMAIQTAMTSSFTELFRLCTRSAEYVSLFIDDHFKRGLRGKSDAEVDAALDRATVMVQHVTEKDMLERYYQKHLARRLLHNKSENPEAEKLMIARMQAELGKAFTAKFEGMFKDVAASAELTREYAQYVREIGGRGGPDPDPDTDADADAPPDLAVSVLTSNNWPPEVMGRASQLEAGLSNAPAGCTYPPEIQRLQQSFLAFYLRNRSGRVLSWVGSAGTADVRCVFPPAAGHDKGPLSRERRYELNVPTHGMVVLMLFNGTGAGWLGFDEIQAQTNIPPADLTRALAALSIPPRCRVLRKEPASKTIRPTDRFAFNSQFVSKALRIKVPVIHALSKVEGDDERRATEEKNNQTRSHTIEAAVVRIMKQRKQLAHTALVTEVVTQLASLFRPEVATVKKRIEDLIAREYLERIEDSDPPAYRYMA